MRKETLFAPMSGIIYKIYTPTGAHVNIDEKILDIECMKLFHGVTAGLNGKINLTVKDGEFVQEEQELGFILEE